MMIQLHGLKSLVVVPQTFMSGMIRANIGPCLLANAGYPKVRLFDQPRLQANTDLFFQYSRLRK
ncbi:hypothetical protein BMS3Bbin04_01344 [bacterium BMS3Bbin04]|nr:hypothetical protein BMS3Bbin04_01344 [bacterium BMS3Bbin04]